MKYCINTNNKKTFAVEKITETAVLLVVNGEIKTIKPSTFKRYYKLLNDELKVDDQKTQQVAQRLEQSEQQQKVVDQKNSEAIIKKHNVEKRWQAYYKPYQKNGYPLWDAVIERNTLIVRDSDKNTRLECKLSNTKTCIVIKQQDGSKRYFTKFTAARKHVLYNQDIRTINSIGVVFDKWLASAQLAV